MSEKKYKIITLGDHPLTPSGVGSQSRYIFEGLLKTGKYQIRSLGGAIKHAEYRPQSLPEYGDDWIILPVDGYGDENLMRQILDNEKPDAIFFFTDPRFFVWLFNMSDEIRDRGIPLLYYHVWDELPVPRCNKDFYHSCDFIGCISKLTAHIVKELEHPDFEYIPHAVNSDIFKPLPEEEIQKKKKELLKENANKFIFFYNSRNARRKMTADIMKQFKMFLDKVGQDKALLLMHTDPHDHEGSNLIAVAEMLGIHPNQLSFSTGRLEQQQMAEIYNIADVTVNLSNNEGFGLSSLESLMCGTPTVSNRTGGLQDQNIDDQTGEHYGVSIKPAVKSLTGSQQIPYIYDCRCLDDDVIEAFLKIYNMTKEERKALGDKCTEHARKKFAMNDMVGKWDAVLERKIKEFENGYPDRIRFTAV